MKNFLSQSLLFENIQTLLSRAIVSPNIGSKFKAYQEKGTKKFKYMLKFSLLTTTKRHIVEFFHINLYIISLLQYRLSWKQNINRSVSLILWHRVCCWYRVTDFLQDILHYSSIFGHLLMYSEKLQLQQIIVDKSRKFLIIGM